MHYIYPNGDEVSNIDIVYLCKDYEGVLKPQVEEVLELAYSFAHELPDKLSPSLKHVILQWIKQKKEQVVK